MNKLIPIGSSIQESCPKCRTKTNGKVNEKNHVTFLCPVCGHTWDYHIMGAERGSKFRIDVDELIKRNPQLSINRGDFNRKPS